MASPRLCRSLRLYSSAPRAAASASWQRTAGFGAAGVCAAGALGLMTGNFEEDRRATADSAIARPSQVPTVAARPSLHMLPAHLAVFAEHANALAEAVPSLVVPLAAEAQPTKSFHVIAAPGTEAFAEWLVKHFPRHFTYHASKWESFPDGTDNITLGGFTPVNEIRGSDVLFLASFHSNATTLTQYHALVGLCESFIHSLTVLLPYYPTATMERVTNEGTIATANTMAKLFSHLPSTGKPTRLMVYDIHTLQNRFFFDGSTYPQLCTAFPLILDQISALQTHSTEPINCVVFPDDGAEKRFGYHFKKAFGDDVELVTCSKHRDKDIPGKRNVVISDGSPKGKHVIIIDGVWH